jgi:hypothetical protein
LIDFGKLIVNNYLIAKINEILIHFLLTIECMLEQKKELRSLKKMSATLSYCIGIVLELIPE